MKFIGLFALLAFLLPAVLAQQQSSNNNIMMLAGPIAAGCFECAAAPVGSTWQASSSLSADDACGNAQNLAELDMRRQCFGFSCAASSSSSSSSGQNATRCALSLSNSMCRVRLHHPEGSRLWLCSVCCEGSCACEQAIQQENVPLPTEIPVAPAGTTAAPTTTAPTTLAPTTTAPTTLAPTTLAPTTLAPTTAAPTTSQAPATTIAPSGQSVQIFGLNHLALGSATLTVERDQVSGFNETLLVSNLSSGTSNGVRIELPANVTRHDITMEVPDDFQRGSLEFTPFGNIRNMQNIAAAQGNVVLLPGTENVQEIWSFTIRSRGDGTAELTFQPSPNFPVNSLQVESAVGATDILGSFQVSGEDLSSSQPLVVFPVGRFTVTPFIFDLNGAPAVMIMFERQSQVMLVGAPAQQDASTTQQPSVVLGDRIILRALDGFAGPLRVTQLSSDQILGSDMDSFRILNETVVMASSSSNGDDNANNNQPARRRFWF